MRVLINATILNQSQLTGLGVYTLNILVRLLPLLQQDSNIQKISIIGDTGRLSELLPNVINGIKTSTINLSTINPLLRLFYLNRIVARERHRNDVIFYSPVHHGVIVNGIRQVITIHDLFAMLFPHNYRMQHYYFRYYLPTVIKRTNCIITDSNNTAVDLTRFYKTLPPTITSYLAFDAMKTAAPEQPDEWLSGKSYFLFVGPNYMYKNADRTITAFIRFASEITTPEYNLVFTGGRKPYLDYLQKFIKREYPEWSKRIHFTGFVSNQELAWLYQNACCTLITTLYEGFGLPALEAMYFGCPVIASKVASLPEVCGDAVRYVDPYNTTEIAEAMKDVIMNKNLRQMLITKGKSNLKRFNWNETTLKIYDVIKKQLNLQ